MEKKNCVCDRSFSVGHSTGFLTPQRKQHVFKTPETKHPGTRQLNHANRKKEMNILQIGLGFLFICFFFHFTDCQACWSFPGAVPVFRALMHLSMKCRRGGRQGIGWGFDFFQKFAIKFPAHGQIIPVKCNQISPPQAAHCCQSQGRT